MRCAIFFPMPGACVSIFSSPVMMDSARRSGGATDRMESAALGPTPETPIIISKQDFSSSSIKP